MTLHRFATLAVVPILLLGAAGCAGGTATGDWDRFVDRFLESHYAANPDVAVDKGRHEFDGLLPDWSAAGLTAEIGRLQAFREAALAFEVDRLDAPRRLERDHFLAVVDGRLFWLDTAEWPHRNPAFYRSALDPNVYVSRPYASREMRIQALTRWAEAVPRALRQIRANLRTPLPRSYIDIGRSTFGGLASYLENDVPTVFAAVADGKLRSQFERATAGAVQAFREIDAWLETQRSQQTEDFALGAGLFSEMLRATERVDVPLDRLESINDADLERNLAALREACTSYAPGASTRDCIARAQANKPEGGAVAGARRQLVDLERFLRAADLVTIPGTERAEVEESPPYQRSNAAYIDIPGPFEEGLPSVYYIAPPDPSWTAEEQADYVPGETRLLFISVHEVWPGHFLQFLHANRSASTLGRVFVGYAFAEGWAHYTEEMMWEAGFSDGDAETHIGQILNALRRNIRYRSAIGLHARGMSVAESERQFLEQAFLDPGNARQQAARGTYDPGYLNYTLGKLMIRKLRADWTASRGGRPAWRAFHDEFLSFGGPPVPLVRGAMLGEDAGSPL